MKNVIVVNNGDLEEKKKKIRKDGSRNFHVVTDFDRTITYGLSGDKKRITTVISQLRSDSKYLGEDYMKKANELFDIYRPLEIDPKIPLAEKKKKMHEWWMKHFDLIAQVGLTKKLIERVVRERPLKFRKGSLEFLNFLNKNNIPIIFMSAAPGDMIEEYLRQDGLLLPNVYVVSNLYEWDKKGNALRIIEPIIHSLNKDETSIKGFSVYNLIKNRKNVLLLGDDIGDVGMVKGFDYDNLISVGFLNENIDEQLNSFKQNFDVIISNDGSMDYVNKLIKEMIK